MPYPAVHLIAGPFSAANAPLKEVSWPSMPVFTNVMGRRLVMRGEQTIVLSRLQHQLLMLLLARRGCVVPRSEIERALYGRPRRDASDASNTVAVCISQLRRKLGSNLIITIHGVGYSIPSFD